MFIQGLEHPLEPCSNAHNKGGGREASEGTGSYGLMAYKGSGYVTLRNHQNIYIQVILLLSTPSCNPLKYSINEENMIQ